MVGQVLWPPLERDWVDGYSLHATDSEWPACQKNRYGDYGVIKVGGTSTKRWP